MELLIADVERANEVCIIRIYLKDIRVCVSQVTQVIAALASYRYVRY